MVKPRENRVPIMMSDEEMKAIDDWRFENRIATRSDAIRRLVQIGLRTSKALPLFAIDVADVLDLASEAIDIPEEVLISHELDGLDKVEIDQQIAHKLYDAVNFTFNRQFEAQDRLLHLLVELSALMNQPELQDAIEAADKLAKSEFRSEEVLSAVGEARRPQLEAWRRRRKRIAEQRGKQRVGKGDADE